MEAEKLNNLCDILTLSRMEKKKGAIILVGRCLSKVNIPYFPFREAFDAYISTISDEKAKSCNFVYRRLHWADQLSLSRLLIIGTYRPEELIYNEEKGLHPLEVIMFSMSREDLLFKMELNRLKRNDFPFIFYGQFLVLR